MQGRELQEGQSPFANRPSPLSFCASNAWGQGVGELTFGNASTVLQLMRMKVRVGAGSMSAFSIPRLLWSSCAAVPLTHSKEA